MGWPLRHGACRVSYLNTPECIYLFYYILFKWPKISYAWSHLPLKKSHALFSLRKYPQRISQLRAKMWYTWLPNFANVETSAQNNGGHWNLPCLHLLLHQITCCSASATCQTLYPHPSPHPSSTPAVCVHSKQEVSTLCSLKETTFEVCYRLSMLWKNPGLDFALQSAIPCSSSMRESCFLL